MTKQIIIDYCNYIIIIKQLNIFFAMVVVLAQMLKYNHHLT